MHHTLFMCPSIPENNNFIDKICSGNHYIWAFFCLALGLGIFGPFFYLAIRRFFQDVYNDEQERKAWRIRTTNYRFREEGKEQIIAVDRKDAYPPSEYVYRT